MLCFVCCTHYTELERKIKISLAWTLWVIFGPQIGYGPHLDYVLAKKFKILLAWSLLHFISQHIHFLSAWATLIWQHTQKRAAVNNSTTTEIGIFIGMKPVGNFWFPNQIWTLGWTPSWWWSCQKVNFILAKTEKTCFLG